MNLGQNYPSDCLLTAVPTLAIVGLWYFVCWADKAIALCPTCNDLSNDGKDTFCYADSLEIQDDEPHVMTRSDFSVGDSNSLSTTIISLGAFTLFSVLSFHPIDFWKKLSYFAPSLLALYLFDNILLCPGEGNDFRTVPSPKALSSAVIDGGQTAIALGMLIFSFGTTWIVNNLLGNRTASLLSYILRTFFFGIILVQTLLTLITFRLVLVEHEINE